MPARVLVELPPLDGPFLSEEALADVVLEMFFAARRSGLQDELPCSVSSVRLQQLTRQRYPHAYERLVQKGRWRGKWHQFVFAVAGLRCFVYSPCDYAHATWLDALTAPGELRCCPVGETHLVVRWADDAVGKLLCEHVLCDEAMGGLCAAAAQRAQADNRRCCRHRAAGRRGVSWWTPSLVATYVGRLAAVGSGEGQGPGGVTDSLRHCAANELTSLVVEENALARHISVSKLCRHVLRCIIAWERAASAQRAAANGV